jgi:pimeloyl-ACP methyl ester carboxylesterase
MAPASEDEMPETLVLVPGLNCTPALFAAQIAALGSDCDILLADNSRDETMAGIARRLLAAAPGRFALAGLSMGGYIALEAMHQAPERVTRLALLDTNAVADGLEPVMVGSPLLLPFAASAARRESVGWSSERSAR